jgi:hypothetical protein
MDADEQNPENPDLAKDSQDVFATIAQDTPKESKFSMIKAYVEVYGAEALPHIKDQVFIAGYREMDVAKLKLENPSQYSRFLSLAYALSLYREDGFMAAIDLIRSGVVLRKEEAPKTLPALYFISSAAIMNMIDKHIVDKKPALSMLDIMINDVETRPMEKALFLEFAIHIVPEAIKNYKESKIQAVRTIAEARLEEMK